MANLGRRRDYDDEAKTLARTVSSREPDSCGLAQSDRNYLGLATEYQLTDDGTG